MVIDKLAEAYGVDPKYIELNDGVYSLITVAGADRMTVKVPIMYADNDVNTAFLPGDAAIANYVMNEMLAKVRSGRWSTISRAKVGGEVVALRKGIALWK